MKTIVYIFGVIAFSLAASFDPKTEFVNFQQFFVGVGLGCLFYLIGCLIKFGYDNNW